MSMITMKYEFGGRGNYIRIQVEETDVKTQQLIVDNNREVWRTEKRLQRYYSKFSINVNSISDNTSNPLFKRILQEKEEHFKKGLNLLSEAQDTLTIKQREVFQLRAKDKLTFKAIGELKGITPRSVQEHYHAAIRKLRNFYSKIPFFLEFFPSLKDAIK